jgi:hypothetical protein
MIAIRHLPALLALALALLGNPSPAQEQARTSELSPLDRQFMRQQRELLQDLVARHYGRQFNGGKANDLPLLQRLLDQRLVRNDQTRELQAMGVIMGDLLAADLGLDWVVYEDREGRSRALRYRQSDNYLFPITMISRRREVDNRAPVAEIYAKAEAAMRAVMAALPFQ